MSTTPHNPYPGARPLNENQRDLLFGREFLLAQFLEAVQQRSVIELMGASGVGKTSLIRAGLVGRISDRTGLLVRPFSEWSMVQGETSAERYASALCLALGPHSAGLPDPSDDPLAFVDTVQGRWRHRLVVVFDQLEELLRDNPAFGRTFIADIVTVAQLYPDGYRQVVSARREYKYEFAPIEEQLHEKSWQYIAIPPIPVEALPNLISGPLEGTGMAVDPRLRDALAAGWSATQLDDADGTAAHEGRDLTGLLHLQAFLYSAYEQLGPQEVAVISSEALAEHVPSLDMGALTTEPTAFFATALDQYVTMMMDRAQDEYRAGSPPGSARAQAALETVRIAALLPVHLSSGSYKLVRGTDELAGLVLERDLRELQNFDPGVRDLPAESVARELEHLCRERGLSESPEMLESIALGSLADLGSGQDGAWGDDWAPAGRMSGSTALRAAAEIVASYERAITWLERADLVRLTTTVDRSERLLSLVHDGIGRALRHWAREVDQRPDVRIATVTAITGRQVLYRPPGRFTALGPAELPSLKKLAWLGCQVTASFSGVVFEDCNFAGILFNYCEFTDVVFKDCVLGSAMFKNSVLTNVRLEDCAIGGMIIRDSIVSGSLGLHIEDTATPEPGTPLKPLLTLDVSPHLGGSRSMTLSGGGLTLKNVHGYGMVLDGVTGGPWTIDGGVVEYVRVSAGGRLTGGRLINNPRVSRASVDEACADNPFPNPEPPMTA